jgi:SPX domain protein involved in polyphosphate accumulation
MATAAMIMTPQRIYERLRVRTMSNSVCAKTRLTNPAKEKQAEERDRIWLSPSNATEVSSIIKAHTRAHVFLNGKLVRMAGEEDLATVQKQIQTSA